MPKPLLVDAQLIASGDLRGYLSEWMADLRASNRAERTRATYGEAVRFFADFLEARGLSTRVEDVRPEHIRAWINAMADRGLADTSRAARYAALRSFYSYLIRDGAVTVSPMAATRPPQVAIAEVPIITEEEYAAIRRACAGRAWEAARDKAMLDLLWSTGMRRAELTGLGVGDLEFREEGGGLAHVMGKGARPRVVAFDPETGKTLKAWLRHRAGRPQASLDALWLGIRGPMTGSGIAQALRARARAAGVSGFHLHRLRHSWAHGMKSRGHTDETTATLGGWRSDRMLRRYGAATATDRAVAAYFERPPR